MKKALYYKEEASHKKVSIVHRTTYKNIQHHYFIGTKELTRKYEVSKSHFSDNDTYSQVFT